MSSWTCCAWYETFDVELHAHVATVRTSEVGQFIFVQWQSFESCEGPVIAQVILI
jgi:hypothetical protein